MNLNSPDGVSNAESPLKNVLVKSYKHIMWANTQIIEAMKKSDHPLEKALSLLSHILAAEKVWLARIMGEDASAFSIWPSSTLEECERLAEQNNNGYLALFDRLHEADFAAAAAYKNSQGTPFTTEIIDILTQVSLHGSYHRGQIATLLKQAGLVPVNTDYITYVRQQTVN